MDIRPECVPCLMKRVLFQAELANNGTEFDALKEAMKVFSAEFKEGVNSAEVATKVHTAAYNAMNLKDPYIELKLRADEVAEKYMNAAERYISSSADPIRAAILVASIGNIMDFGLKEAISDPDQFGGKFKDMMDQGIGHDDSETIKEILSDASSVIYIFDNCGESQLDKLLIRRIRAAGTKVIGVVRGEPILNDVALSDAIRTGLDKEVDKMFTTSEFRIGLKLENLSEDLKKEITSASLMIAKGMANFEALSDQKVPIPVAYILRSKCAPVADALGVPIGINVVKVRMP